MKKLISAIIIMILAFSMSGTVSFASTEATETEVPSVGAIRWDAWYGHTNKGWDVVSQVEKTLSPTQFHFRAPFFARVTDDNKIVISNYTQEIFDREMEYAKYAGIDYFAYIWYDEGDETNAQKGMQKARKFHQESKYRSDVKMCVVDPPIHDDARIEMSKILVSDYYMTVLDGRPLMYYINSNDNLASIVEKIQYYEALCNELNVKKPYAVIMNPSASTAKSNSADAVSKYAIDGYQLSYDELVKKAEERWNTSYLQSRISGFQFVPTITYGWHPEPRYINPVTWMTVDNEYWCDYATDIELLNHLAYALSYMKHPSIKPYTEANTVIAYAWNEHDEGGWICPTIEVDANGKQLYNADGTPKINERRINATKAAIDFIKSGNLVKVTVGSTSNGSSITKASDAIENVESIINEKVFNGIGEFKGATVDIGTSLTMNFFVSNSVDINELSVKFTSSSGRTVTKNGVKENDYIKFSYTGINPQCMADTITAELIYNGRVIETIENYSVKQYCDNLYNKTNAELEISEIKYNALKKLMADMLYYGKTAQLYKNYNTENLADNLSWVEDVRSEFTVPKGVREISGNADLSNRVKALGLHMANVNKIYFRITLTDGVTVLLNGRAVDEDALIKEGENAYLLYSDEIYATEFDKIFTLEIVKDDEIISTVKYNVNSYIESKHTAESVGDIVKGLNQYGVSAKAYKATFDGDNDFTFDEEEFFPDVEMPEKDGDITFSEEDIF